MCPRWGNACKCLVKRVDLSTYSLFKVCYLLSFSFYRTVRMLPRKKKSYIVSDGARTSTTIHMHTRTHMHAWMHTYTHLHNYTISHTFWRASTYFRQSPPLTGPWSARVCNRNNCSRCCVDSSEIVSRRWHSQVVKKLALESLGFGFRLSAWHL